MARKYEIDYDFADVANALEEFESVWWEKNDTGDTLRTEETDDAINSKLDSAGLRGHRANGGMWWADPVAHADDYRSAIHCGLDQWFSSLEKEEEEEEEDLSGWWAVTCTAHFSPVLRGPFASEAQAAEWCKTSAPDRGVHNSPPCMVVYTEEPGGEDPLIESAVETLVAVYKSSF